MKILTQAEIDEKLRLHKIWLKYEDGGVKADLRGADLRDANLRGADLRGTNLNGANLSDAILYNANLRGADLRGTNLSDAILYNANLRGTDFDYSCLPLWCGSLKANFDDRLAIQLLYHLLSIAKHSTNISDELKAILLTDVLKEQANKFHRVYECGEI